MSGVFSRFLFISTFTSCALFSPGSVEAHVEYGGYLNGHLMTSCDGNVHIKN